MKVLVIGSGAREHAFCWKLMQSDQVQEVYCAPGNPGIATVAKCLSLKVDDLEGLLEFAKGNRIDLTLVGPELPLTLGIVDLFRKNGLAIFGPSMEASKMESSKNFAKELMVSIGVPTAHFTTVTDLDAAKAYVQSKGLPIVIKADGLAAGKGVFVCFSQEDLSAAYHGIFTELRADRVVIEEYLEGIEASYIVATDGVNVIPMAASHDYKRLNDGQRGPNTGGMGSVSPTSHLTEEQEKWTLDHVMIPVIKEMKRRGIPFTGFLYGGLMISPKGEIKVLEFNARMGDPECQSVMRRLDSDLFTLLNCLSTGAGDKAVVSWKKESVVCIVMAAYGYPESPRKGDEIVGIEQAAAMKDVAVFHAGTALDSNGRLVTSGGRVLSVTATGENLNKARLSAYRGADMIQFRGAHIRRDIGLT